MLKKAIATDLGKLLRKKRRDLMWTQDKLSEILNLTHVSISTYERGLAIPNGYIFLKLIKVLGISKEELNSLIALAEGTEMEEPEAEDAQATEPEENKDSRPELLAVLPINNDFPGACVAIPRVATVCVEPPKE